MAKSIKSFPMKCVLLVMAFTITLCISITFNNGMSYAEEYELPKDRLIIKGATEQVPWEYGYYSLDNWQAYDPYALSTPIVRWGNYDESTGGKLVAWTTTIENFEKCGKLTKISLIKTEGGDELASLTAADPEKGIQKTDFLFGANRIWPGMEKTNLNRYNGICFNNIAKIDDGTLWFSGTEIRDRNTYVGVQGTVAKLNENTNYDYTVILYFNGSENGHVIPEEVQAVIDLIDKIGEITEENYLSKESDITAAKDAYEKLETDDKALVENYETLTAAETAFAAFKLAAAKAAAINELKGTFDKSLYSGEELAKLNKAIEDGETAINDATSEEAVSIAERAAMEEARKAKTDAEIAEEALQKAKNDAKEEIEHKYDLTQYSGDEKAKLEKAIADAKAAIDAAESLEAVTQAKKNGIAEADKAKTDTQIADEEKAEIAKKKTAAKKYTVKGLKVKAKNRKFTVSWKKTAGATGYQVQYKLKSAKKYKTLKTLKKLKVTSKKLKKGKKYQFKVRTYTSVNGSKVYGKWTKIKTIKCR